MDVVFSGNRRIGKVQVTNSFLISLIIIYALFAFNRIKYAIPIVVDGTSINNTIVLIALVFLFSLMLQGMKVNGNFSFGMLVVLYLFISIFIAVLNKASIEEGFYAFFQYIIPFSGFVIASKLELYEIKRLFKFIIIISGIYALLTIAVAANYNTFAGILGVSEIVTYSRFARVNMPIGSSITVSYYFDIVIPICAVGIEKYKRNKNMRIISIISLVSSMLCVVLLNSRAAIITLIIIALVFFKYNVTISRKSVNIMLYLLVAIIVGSCYVKYGDIDRFINRTSSVMASDLTRYEEALKAIGFFLNNPIAGTGIGAIYNRANSGVLQYSGISILSDPHNAYVLLLSEVGIVGLFLVFLFIFFMLRKIKSFDSTKHGRFIRKTLLISIFIQSFFGSHIINEPAYSVIFWILLGLSVSINKKQDQMEW